MDRAIRQCDLPEGQERAGREQLVTGSGSPATTRNQSLRLRIVPVSGPPSLALASYCAVSRPPPAPLQMPGKGAGNGSAPRSRALGTAASKRIACVPACRASRPCLDGAGRRMARDRPVSELSPPLGRCRHHGVSNPLATCYRAAVGASKNQKFKHGEGRGPVASPVSKPRCPARCGMKVDLLSANSSRKTTQPAAPHAATRTPG